MYVKFKFVVLQVYRNNSVKKVLIIYRFLVNISFIQKERCLDAYNVEESHLRITNFRPGRIGSIACTIRSEFSRAER